MGLFDFFKTTKTTKSAGEDPPLPLSAATDLVQQYVRIANESLQIANNSKNLDTRRSRLALVRAKLAEVKELAAKYPRMEFTSLGDFEKSIEAVERETDEMREEASPSEQAKDDLVTGKRSVVSGWDVDPVMSELHSDAVPEGVFWHDHIKTLRDDPEARLQVARAYLPLPAAFREAAVALRALIRSKKKQGSDSASLLEDLYRLAAQENFFSAAGYIPDVGPSFNVAAEVPRELWLGMNYPYEEIGYEHLQLLNKTDRKWVVEAWGEPATHVTAQTFHDELWQEAVKRLRQKNKDRDNELQNLLRGL